jgi:UDP-N-acetylglucosamine--N-acetylmuramyl-(pentapeptide) pyrophosphoryl-undecaprenol N-acetylglucosamine transferase
MPYSFAFTGGGTGGHVIPALAVARILREREHSILFIGTRQGIESRLVPESGFEIEYIRSSGLNRVALRQRVQTMVGLPGSVAAARRILLQYRPSALFSMGGFVAGPVMLAAAVSRIPIIVLEPNAIPGFANRRMARYVYRALLGFEATRAWFPSRRSEVTGVPVRPEFFSVKPKSSGIFTVLITGGSRGARTLNRAARESWPFFRESGKAVRIIHQTGPAEHAALAAEFANSGLDGRVVPFIQDMAAAFADADLVVGRSGAGAVNELAAAGMPSVLVPFPFSADDHQRKNAEAFSQAGAARLMLDQEATGERLFREVENLRANPETLAGMRESVRQFSRPHAAERAASVLEEAATSYTSPRGALTSAKST